ncbi:hypothetical protein SAMN05216378_2309 [Paenibacillus catalpae]|uniref:Uncharacterized protein n=1 Tax=Paenibacillus catalpae TaxID=1045775 RepID=A0A1I1XW79_9BACL|nr:hypothetical protein [Paenibacillus lupini]SFE09760.1 hypothetical protein SAMN05216378_2309 [Paenibacillus catalpae]
MLSYFLFYNNGNRWIDHYYKREVNTLLNHPFFFEEQMRLKNWELKQIDKHAWKWVHFNKRKPALPLSLMMSSLWAFLFARFSE